VSILEPRHRQRRPSGLLQPLLSGSFPITLLTECQRDSNVALATPSRDLSQIHVSLSNWPRVTCTCIIQSSRRLR
jgi:hypothetical protein